MTGPGQPAGGAEPAVDNGDQGDTGAGDAAGGTGPKRDPLYENLPDSHPLVRRHEALKAEHKALKADKIVDGAEDAPKPDGEKIAGLQAEIAGIPKKVAGALRDHLVEIHGFDKDRAELFLTGDTPELLLRQVAALLEDSGAGGKRQNHVPREGTKLSRPKPDSTREFISAITNRDGQ